MAKNMKIIHSNVPIKHVSLMFTICKPETHTDIHSSTRDVIEFRPPLEIAPAYPILEYEADKDPRRVVDASRRRSELHRVEDDGHRDINVPAVWPLALPVPQRNREEDANNSREDFRVVYRTLAELAAWPYNTPAIEV